MPHTQVCRVCVENLDFMGGQVEQSSIVELAEFSLHSIFGGMEDFYLSLIIMALANSRG